jgi:hypothetical protein
VNPLAIILGGSVLAFLVLNRGGTSAVAGEFMAAVNKSRFLSSLPSYARSGKFGDLGEVIWRVSQEEGVSPYLVAGLMSRESNFGRTLAADGTGDEGNGLGVMQVDRRYHKAFVSRVNAAGVPDWKDPYLALKYSVKEILLPAYAYFRRTPAPGATVTVTAARAQEKADQWAKQGIKRAPWKPGVYRDPRPLQVDAAWKAATAAYNGGVTGVMQALVAEGVASGGDGTTTGANYASDVLRRAGAFEAVA